MVLYLIFNIEKYNYTYTVFMIWISSCFAEYMYIINHIKLWPSCCCFAHSLRLPCHVCALSWERVVGAMDSTGSELVQTHANC